MPTAYTQYKLLVGLQNDGWLEASWTNETAMHCSVLRIKPKSFKNLKFEMN